MSGGPEVADARLRPAVPADLEDIAAIDAAVSPRAFGRTHLARYCAGSADTRALVCETAGTPVGFVLFSLVLGEGSIDNIAVAAARQGGGIGGRLLGAALDAMRAAGMRRCLLEVRASNLPARALYSRCGFGEDGVRRNYYKMANGREDAVLMSRRL